MKKKGKKKSKYDMTRTDEDEKQEIAQDIKDIDKRVDRILDIKKLDEENPLERAIKLDFVKKNPPKPDYMQVNMYKGFTENGEGFIVSESTQKGKKVRMLHDPYRIVDLNTSIMADVTRCPSHVMPQLIDEYVQINLAEKKEFKPEPAKEEFRYWWLLILLMMVPGILLLILYILR